jgi:hypothetical protein
MKKLLTLLTIYVFVMIANTYAGWIYLVPGYDWFGYRGRDGVLHAWQADEARYDQATRVYQVKINGRWLTVGEDVEQLTD